MASLAQVCTLQFRLRVSPQTSFGNSTLLGAPNTRQRDGRDSTPMACCVETETGIGSQYTPFVEASNRGLCKVEQTSRSLSATLSSVRSDTEGTSNEYQHRPPHRSRSDTTRRRRILFRTVELTSGRIATLVK